MNNLVIYRSLFGSSERYAKWLNEEIGGEIRKYNRVKGSDLARTDSVILVGATYAGWMGLSGFIKKNLATLMTKNLFYVNVGMAPEDDQWNQKTWAKLPKSFRDKAKMYKIMGKMGKEDRVSKDNLKKVIEDIV
jgi:flavodoxin